VREGSSGRDFYCSKEHRALWSPQMRAIAQRIGAKDPKNLLDQLNLITRNNGTDLTASVLGVNTRTLVRWMDRLRTEYPLL